ncbi:hypothetical protein CHUAL_001839 [Chamberlinius hualienensis]
MAIKVLSVFMLIILIVNGLRTVPPEITGYDMEATQKPQFSIFLTLCAPDEVFDRDRRRCTRLRTVTGLKK